METPIENKSVTPLVSVIMPVYNGEQYLAEAIDSILAQTWKNIELWICDDCSTDTTPGILEQYARIDSRVRTIRNCENRGIAETLNVLLDKTSSEFIARMDADDVALPTRIKQQYDYMQQHGLDVCGSWTQNKNGYLAKVKYPASNKAIRLYLMFRPAFAHPAVMFRKSALEGQSYRQNGLVPEDYDLWTRLPVSLKFGNVPETLLLYRRHAGQITRKIKKEHAKHIKEDYSRRLLPDISEKQLEIHLKLRGDRKPDENDLREIREWLSFLSKRYTDNDCLQILRNEWFFAVSSSSVAGISAWRLYNISGNLKLQKRATPKVMLFWLTSLLHLPYSRVSRLLG